jgi:hypothetical protein
MVRNGPTKRKRGDIWAQLGVSACVLLLPPLVMAAGVMFYDSSPPQSAGLQSAAQRAEAPASSVAKTDSMTERSDMRPDAGTFALASAEKHPVITEKRPVAAQPPVAAPPAATAQPAAPAPRQAGGQPEGTKDPARYNGPAPVTLVRAEKAGEQSAMAAIEASPSAAKAADAPAAVPETSPAATRMRASHARGRHEPRAVYRVKQQRTPSLSDIFLRPTARPRRS